MNGNIIKGKWLEIRGDLQKTWGQLTNDELDQTKGDLKVIGGLLQQKYGEVLEGYEGKVAEIFKRFDLKKDQLVDAAKSNLKN